MPPMHLDVTPVLPQPTGEVRVQRGEARRGEGAARRGEATRDEGAAWLCLKRLWFVTMQQNAGKKRPNTRRKAFTPVAPGARCAERVYLRLILRHLASLFPARPARAPRSSMLRAVSGCGQDVSGATEVVAGGKNVCGCRGHRHGPTENQAERVAVQLTQRRPRSQPRVLPHADS